MFTDLLPSDHIDALECLREVGNLDVRQQEVVERCYVIERVGFYGGYEKDRDTWSVFRLGALLTPMREMERRLGPNELVDVPRAQGIGDVRVPQA